MMKASDFDLSKDLKFDLDSGITSFRDNRMLIFEAGAIGAMRQQLIDELGFAGARRFFLRLGFRNGYADMIQMRINYDFDSEFDLFSAGPRIHTYEGIAKATPRDLAFDRADGSFRFAGIWTNSYEAEQHLSYNEPAIEPVCWSLMGYASGHCTAFFGKPLICIEPCCVGKGDDHCEWLVKPPEAWGDEAAPYVKALRTLFEPLQEGRISPSEPGSRRRS